MNSSENLLSYIPNNILTNLHRADQMWQNLKEGKLNIPNVVNESSELLNELDCDIVISGGTLGILLGATLQKLGWRVTLIERGILRGREQEWNISRQELETFIELDLLTESELNQAIATEYNPARISFHQGYELWVKDVLNIGVDPVFLLETLKRKFLDYGGKLLENTPFAGSIIHPDGVTIKAGTLQLKTRLLIDAMGHFSPIVQQVRQGAKPEGVCLVVGSCATGYQNNSTGDLIASFTPIMNQCQYFWEAFPARDGRTTYLFTYIDAEPERFSLQYLMTEYLRLLPEYQNISLEELQFKRFLFGFFPAYRQSPLPLNWNRILPVGDSSGSQSPVSFGGFGAIVRHLKRLTFGIDEALKIDALNHKDLALLQPYQPNIAVTWLFQKTMSVELKQQPQPEQINNLMSGVFAVMDRLGDPVLKPFLQDVIQFIPLAKTLILVNPKFVLPILPQVGIISLLDWLKHFFNLGLYTVLFQLKIFFDPLTQKLPLKQQYYYHRCLDAWQYGSGKDYDRC